MPRGGRIKAKGLPADGQRPQPLPMSVMQPQNIQAAAFVPKSIRGTLGMMPGMKLAAENSTPNLDRACLKIRSSFCPVCPLQIIFDSIVIPGLVVPDRQIHAQKDDSYYSLWHQQQALNGNGIPERSVSKIEDSLRDLSRYCQIYEELLTEERLELLLRYERYTQYDIPIKTTIVEKDSNLIQGSFESRGISGSRPAIQVGDSVLLRTSSLVSTTYLGVIGGAAAIELELQCLGVERGRSKVPDSIRCSWISDETWKKFSGIYQTQNQQDSKTFHARVVPKKESLTRCLTALSWLSTIPREFAENLIFSTRAPSPRPLPDSISLEDTQILNTSQLSFVRGIVQRTLDPDFRMVRTPMVLTGPAGTGKTKTLLCAIRQVIGMSTADCRNRVLVCTPSHTAADVVTRQLAKHYDKSQIFRLYDADRPIAFVPIAMFPFTHQDQKTGTFTLPDDTKQLMEYSVIVCTCQDAHLLYKAGLTNQQLHLQRSHSINALMASGINIDENTISRAHQPHFTHLFIDEAAQATEPESLIPLSVVVDPLAYSRKVEIALVGDPRQLSPRVYSSKAAESGLDQSWMERLLRRKVECLGGGDEDMLGPEMTNMDELLRYSFARDGNEQLSFFLTANYRGHPSFLIMPSCLFYADKLQWASYDRPDRNEMLETEWCERLRHVEALSDPVIPQESTAKKQYNFPIHFLGVVGVDKSASAKSGVISEELWENEDEAKAVAEIVQNLTTKGGVSSQQIGVMAPYRGQVVLIRNMLRKKGLSSVDVGTIEDYQGIEKEAIILSLTRSNQSFVKYDVDRRIGVFGQRKQSNVALTRAEQLQIVVGNPNTMASDQVWRQWLWFCLRHGLWYGEEGDMRTVFEELDSTPKQRSMSNSKIDSDFVLVSRLEEILCG